jgi:hypothetical protein
LYKNYWSFKGFFPESRVTVYIEYCLIEVSFTKSGNRLSRDQYSLHLYSYPGDGSSLFLGKFATLHGITSQYTVISVAAAVRISHLTLSEVRRQGEFRLVQRFVRDSLGLQAAYSGGDPHTFGRDRGNQHLNCFLLQDREPMRKNN